MADTFHLERFREAQDPLIAQIRAELRAGEKRSHWMWFTFPQGAGLGRSQTSRYYGIGSLEEARAFLEHPVLGPRLIECAALVNAAQGKSVLQIFGNPDDRKFHSSMTLFAMAALTEPEFSRALSKYFGGARDAATIEWLAER